jgi:hypothetical protein
MLACQLLSTFLSPMVITGPRQTLSELIILPRHGVRSICDLKSPKSSVSCSLSVWEQDDALVNCHLTQISPRRLASPNKTLCLEHSHQLSNTAQISFARPPPPRPLEGFFPWKIRGHRSQQNNPDSPPSPSLIILGTCRNWAQVHITDGIRMYSLLLSNTQKYSLSGILSRLRNSHNT